jgi:hypothetical protein
MFENAGSAGRDHFVRGQSERIEMLAFQGREAGVDPVVLLLDLTDPLGFTALTGSTSGSPLHSSQERTQACSRSS